MGKQTVQAKKVWSISIESILVFLSYLIFLANLCEEFNLQSGGPSSLFVLGAWSQVMRGLKNKALFVQESKSLSDSGSSSNR